ncbi:MAG: hypothetical protein NC310_02905 [Roseburia sp.]|nr:hypothetical protein [Anaeroplasma bactoclasticum]MCM1196007.1 hypothetical protein [Roseburia sp.]MCM1556837.1 hypothetical protein [Anaeroplasma bactoclasticum]
MKKIGKNDDIIRFFKELLKTNKHKDYVLTDDLEVLKLTNTYHLEIPYLLLTSDIDYKEDTIKLIDSLKEQAKECYEISSSVYESLQTKENHAGILAAICIPKYTTKDLGDFIVVLDRLEIPGNIGTIYRTLDACGATGVILVNPISKPHNPKLTASARGTNLILPTVSMSYQEAQNFLQENQYTIYLGEPKLGKDYQSYSYREKIAFVFGNERYGIQEDWYNHPHQKVYIPMQGNNNSLNVGVATSIVVYEAAMQRNFKKD